MARARSGKTHGIGTAALPQGEKYFFGTPEELNNRNDVSGPAQPEPPHFVQISPDNSGKDLNNPTMENRSGHYKFSKGA